MVWFCYRRAFVFAEDFSVRLFLFVLLPLRCTYVRLRAES